MDRVDRATRSRNMARIRGKDTVPERTVRKVLHSHGYRFRLHRRGLPGTPDIVFPIRKKVIFVHGCFWHAHAGCRRATLPETNSGFWKTKISRNQMRDALACDALLHAGWKVLVVWECETRDHVLLFQRLRRYLGPPGRRK
jgi:DNA mismatch endonuclease Vsr